MPTEYELHKLRERERLEKRVQEMRDELVARGVRFFESDENLELKGPYARVWWLILNCPDGATYQDVASAFCETERYYNNPRKLSSYIKMPNRVYSGDDAADRHLATHWHGTKLSGVLHRLWKQGYLKVDPCCKGPRKGRIYLAVCLCSPQKPCECKIPKEILR